MYYTDIMSSSLSSTSWSISLIESSVAFEHYLFEFLSRLQLIRHLFLVFQCVIHITTNVTY